MRVGPSVRRDGTATPICEQQRGGWSPAVALLSPRPYHQSPRNPQVVPVDIPTPVDTSPRIRQSCTVVVYGPQPLAEKQNEGCVNSPRSVQLVENPRRGLGPHRRYSPSLPCYSRVSIRSVLAGWGRIASRPGTCSLGCPITPVELQGCQGEVGSVVHAGAAIARSVTSDT